MWFQTGEIIKPVLPAGEHLARCINIRMFLKILVIFSRTPATPGLIDLPQAAIIGLLIEARVCDRFYKIP